MAVLRIDPDRSGDNRTEIYVRAQEAGGGARRADIAELDTESLVYWVSQHYDDDPEFALRTLCLVLGHDRDAVDEQLEVE